MSLLFTVVNHNLRSASLEKDDETGEIQLLLITPEARKNWTIPWAEGDGVSAPADIAQRAAFRRAGLIGTSLPRPLNFGFDALGLSMEIYPMRVKGTLVAWPERKLWQRDWLSIHAAAKRVNDAALAALLEQIASNPELLREE